MDQYVFAQAQQYVLADQYVIAEEQQYVLVNQYVIQNRQQYALITPICHQVQYDLQNILKSISYFQGMEILQTIWHTGRVSDDVQNTRNIIIVNL